MSGSHRPEEKTVISWVKIFTWRSNGDGINPFGNTLVEDSFIRTQDDSIYANGHGIRRTVFWQVNNMNEFLKREALKKLTNQNLLLWVQKNAKKIYFFICQQRGGLTNVKKKF